MQLTVLLDLITAAGDPAAQRTSVRWSSAGQKQG